MRSVCCVAGGHGVGALPDHGAGAGGGRPAAQAAGVPAEGGRRVSVPAADQQPQGPGPVPGEKGMQVSHLVFCILWHDLNKKKTTGVYKDYLQTCEGKQVPRYASLCMFVKATIIIHNI